MTWTLFWIPATFIAAAAQTARNAMQRSLTATLGTVGASQVRFLYGFPFALVFLLVVALVSGDAVPFGGSRFLAFTAGGAVSQILATVLMLAAMRERSFAVTTALIKTEPVLVAIFGIAVLGDHLTVPGSIAILAATAGVVLMAMKPCTTMFSGEALRPAIYGVVAGVFFAISAVGFRGAILSLPAGSFVLRSTTTLAWSLGMQTAMLVAWLGAFDRQSLVKSFGAWRPSLFAGFMGALASQFWFIGFSLTSAANVRTLALVEVLMAQGVSRKLFSQETSRRDLAGMGLIVIGVVVLLWSQA